MQNQQEYRDLRVAQLLESPTNPRKRFSEETLRELAASFQSQGVLQPLVVRLTAEGNYEVIAGARRLRAARLAHLESVPVRVVQLSDAAAIEARVVENLQREDIHRSAWPMVMRSARNASADCETSPGAAAGSLQCRLPADVDERRKYPCLGSGAGTRGVDRV